ncbi:uncharacterized protein [Ptychodera flava]|uniref:uncharacterized protein n=1 Tax=Ptychodera flava TaxID=63121 RepID=UPI00396A4DF7
MRLNLAVSRAFLVLALMVWHDVITNAEDSDNAVKRTQLFKKFVENLKLSSDQKPEQYKRYKWTIPGMNSSSGRKRNAVDEDIDGLSSALQEPFFTKVQECRNLIADYQNVISLLKKTAEARQQKTCKDDWKAGEFIGEC